MAKEVKEKQDLAYRISAQQLFEKSKARDIITSSLSSDIGLGGGIPRGCTLIVGGKPKSGKTTWSLQYAANAQNQFKGVKVFFFPCEGRLDSKVLSQIRGLKLDIDSFEVVMGEAIADKDGNVVKIKKMPADFWWTKIGETIINHPGCIIIVDSISALSSERELVEGIGYQGRGELQKLEAQFCREYGDLVMPNNVTLFLLAQVQANTSGYGDPLQIKCGNAIRHMGDAILFARNTEKWPDKDGRILGHDINFRIECSPLGPPWIDTKVPLRFGYGIDDIQDIITNAVNWDMIKKKGSWFKLPFIEKDGKYEYVDLNTVPEDTVVVKAQGEEQIRNFMLINPDTSKALDSIIRKNIFG